MRQFETIFLDLEADRDVIPARIFTAEEELPFAGHPVIGAAAAVHERLARLDVERSWVFVIAEREVDVTSQREGDYYAAAMNQGRATFSAPLTTSEAAGFVTALNLDSSDVCSLPMQVVSTGLPYLVVPVTPGGLRRAGILVDDFEGRLATVDARFVYVFDPERREDAPGTTPVPPRTSRRGVRRDQPPRTWSSTTSPTRGTRSSCSRAASLDARAMSITAGADGDLWVGGPVAPVASGRLDAARPR